MTSVSPSVRYACPVCGLDGLHEAPYDATGCASFGICPCCGVEFGLDDATRTHEQLRAAWIVRGMTWWSTSRKPAVDWDPVAQLARARASAVTAVRDTTELVRLQHRVIEMIIATCSADRSVLAAQYAAAVLGPTERTAVGFYVDIEVPSDVPRHVPPSVSVGEVIMEGDGVPAGAGFVLFVREGRLTDLEGYVFDGEWPAVLGDYTLRVVALSGFGH